jgi:hypothetical protein
MKINHLDVKTFAQWRFWSFMGQFFMGEGGVRLPVYFSYMKSFFASCLRLKARVTIDQFLY